MKDVIFREGLEDEERRRVVAVDVEEPSSPLSPVLASTTVIPVPPSQTTANSSRPWNLTQSSSSSIGFVADSQGRAAASFVVGLSLELGFVADRRICHIVSRFQTCSRLMVQY
nr:uncharacterized protein LOC109156702 [Ipomoea trifida]